jgi:sulfide:quinone oxidoreductase
MAHIVIMGAGLGGIPMAYEMKVLLGPEDELTVISNSDVFQFTPSNPWVAVNWRKKEDIVVPMAPIFAKQGIDFIPDGAERVLPEENAIRLVDGRMVTYDYLVIATGPELAFDEIPGFGPHDGFTQSVCHVDHATEAAAAWERFTADPGPVVVGAVQGTSCFGPAYEFALIMETELRRHKIRDKVPMTFVTPEPYIGHFGLGGVGDTKGMLESEFRQRHITWITNARVSRIEDGKAVVTECDSEGAEKRTVELPFKYAMMIPAFRGIKAVAGIDGLVNPRGFVLIDKFQRNPKFENVFGIGVCVAIPPVEQTPVPTGVPKTGFMIESMVTATSHNIRERLDGKSPSHEATWNALCLADFGDRGVALLAMPQMPPRNVNWTYSGKLVHVAKIAFEKYFLRKVRSGVSEPIYEKYGLKLLGIDKLKSLIPHQ